MRTVLALLIAIGMIAGALYFRSRLDAGDDPDNPFTPDEPVRIVCARDLTEACAALEHAGVEVIMEDAGVTADRLETAETADADAWLVTAPWPDLVDDNRARSGAPEIAGDAGAPLARSPGVLVMWEDRLAALQRNCPDDTVTWSCLGDVAGQPWLDNGGDPRWGQIKPSHDHPERGVGLVVLGGIAANRIGRLDFNARDLQSDEFFSWFSNLENEIPSWGAGNGKPITEMLSFGPSKYDAVGTVEAFAAPLVETSSMGQMVTVMYPQPLVTADVVLAPLVGGNGDAAAEAARQVVPPALAGAGWRVQGQQSAAGVPTEPALPAEAQTPSPGALQALRELWDEVT